MLDQNEMIFLGACSLLAQRFESRISQPRATTPPYFLEEREIQAAVEEAERIWKATAHL